MCRRQANAMWNYVVDVSNRKETKELEWGFTRQLKNSIIARKGCNCVKSILKTDEKCKILHMKSLF